MTYKRIIILTVLFVLFISFGNIAVVNADGFIISIEDGGEYIYTENPEITFDIPAGYEITLMEDSETLLSFVSEGNDTVTLPKPLEVGHHKMTAIAKYDGGTFTKEIEFDVNYQGVSDKDSIYINQSKLSATSVSHSNGAAAGTNSETGSVYIKKANFEGKDGTAGRAVGFETTAPVTSASGAADIYLGIWWSSYTLSGVVEIEYDIKIEGKMQFELETKGTGFGNFGPNDMITKGMIAGKVPYETGRWYHIRHSIDLDNARQDLYVDGDKIVDNASVSSPAAINTVKVQARAEASDTVSSVAIDNFVLGYPYTTSADNEIKYLSGGEYVTAQDGVVTEYTDTVRIGVSGISGTKSKIRVFADGEEFLSTDAQFNADGFADITFPEELPQSASIKIIAELSGFSALYRFENRTGEYGISDVEFKNGDGKLYLNDQLCGGDTVTAEVKLYNRGKAKNAVIILALFDGSKTVTLKAKTVSVSDGKTETLVFDIPEEDGNYSAECYLFDSLSSHNPLSKVWSLD